MVGVLMPQSWQAEHHALTREGYYRLTADNNRAVTDPCMSNKAATQWRDRLATVDASPVDAVLDLIEDRVEARKKLAERIQSLPAWSEQETPTFVHGTRAGYMRHLRHGQIACEACIESNRAYAIALREKRKAAN